MRQKHHNFSRFGVITLLIAGLLGWPASGTAQLGGSLPLPPSTTTTPTVLGDATAVRATVLGMTTALADTGPLAGTADALDASMDTGSIPSTLGGEVLSATTIGWPDEVDSAASLANLNVTVAGISISADFVMAEASQVLGAPGSGTSYIDNLSINGTPVAVTGDPNQTIWVAGGQVVINEQTISSDGTAVVNALHVTVSGLADVVVASATAGIH